MGLLWAGLAFAQETKQQQIANWERAKTYTMEYLEAMPEAAYAMKPTPDIRSFAQQMGHIADANYAFASAASGIESPMKGSIEKGDDLSKATITEAVMNSYDFVISAIEGMADSDFDESIKFFGMDVKSGLALEKGFEHQTHHRGQCTIYLRLNGVTPPEEKLF
ncbi:putative damage-inducible protein DinB [Dyadobacter jejuensis]|uniref:Putative damage-inducible protein DinB n=2 Tax=Dyadobacter jejuensis TaxID=1082580 RepID=A0A316ATK3_9BACT|nr:putative damage-inducible protein DinB [Dyadobacter jejuensis]